MPLAHATQNDEDDRVTLRHADDLQHEEVLSADVCIVGGGPAGISLALALNHSPLTVILLESGGEDQDPEARDLNVGINDGLRYYDLDETRHRGFGGASERWAGWCRPMDRSDFVDRPWTGATGWPIEYDELVPYYREAARLCELEGSPFDEPRVDLPPVYGPPFVGDGVGIAVWQGSPPTKFGRRYRRDLADSGKVDVYLHATATEIVTTDDGRSVRAVRGSSRSGVGFEVHAATVVLAAGAIETARLLLASRGTNPAGVGNDHDLVGRYFMEHPHLVTARLIPLPPGMSKRPVLPSIDLGFLGAKQRLALQRPSQDRKVAYVVSEEVRINRKMLNFSTHFRTVSDVDRDTSEAYESFKLVVNNLRSASRTVEQIRSRSLPQGSGHHLGRILTGLPELTRVMFDEAIRRPRQLALYTQCEQAPNRESRVVLDSKRVDSTGTPRVRLDWTLSAIDKASVREAHDVLGTQFLREGLGVLVPEPEFLDDDPDWGPGLRGGHHQMGTARMADDARHGVVDRNCRVHGVDGLHVADSSVFPTVGYANPLLTTVAIARRLGDHLRTTLTGSRGANPA